MDQKFCKKCGKPLPDDYKHNKCERCRSKDGDRIKKGVTVGGTIVGVLGIIGTIAKTFIKRG